MGQNELPPSSPTVSYLSMTDFLSIPHLTTPMLRAARALAPSSRVRGASTMWRRDSGGYSAPASGASTPHGYREETPSEPFRQLQVHDWRQQPGYGHQSPRGRERLERARYPPRGQQRGYHGVGDRYARSRSDSPQVRLDPSPSGRSPLLLGPRMGVGRPTPPPETIFPPGEYVDIAREALGESKSTVTPKLLVLDLNGALVYRPSRGGGDKKKAYPRPYLHCFLQYLFEGGERPWEVFVWSSAQPHNVRHMVETCFGLEYTRGVYPREGSEASEGSAEGSTEEGGILLGVWARDTLGLSSGDYGELVVLLTSGRKVQTRKDLRKVIEAYPQYDLRTTVLLDDSPLKAVFQPWSQIVIPEYDKAEYTDSKRAAERLAADANEPVDEDGYRLRAYSPSRAVGHVPVQAQSGPKLDPSSEPGMDNTLLAVIGILEDMRVVSNVPAWVAAGGIQRPTGERVPLGGEVEDSLPSNKSFVHWYAEGETHAYWIERGKAALARRGIPLSHGLPQGEIDYVCVG